MDSAPKPDNLNPTIGMPLTEDEAKLLWSYKDTHQFKLFCKAVVFMYAKEAAMLVKAKADPMDIVQRQGRLQGLLQARSLLSEGIMPAEEVEPQLGGRHRNVRVAIPIPRKNSDAT
jgi:hypothetical protein